MSAATDKATDGNGWVGRAIRRKEDPRMITGEGTYVDDMTPPGTRYAAIVRSPEAHARIVSIDTSAAKARDDVIAVFTGEDLTDLAAPLPMAWAPPGVEMRTPDHWPLARGKVCHVGDPVAVVIADDKYAVVDAAEDVVVEYDPLPVVIDPEEALEDGAPIIHEVVRHQRVLQVVAGRRRPRGRIRGGRHDRRAADRQPPHGGGGDRAARDGGRVARATLTLTTTTQVPFIVRTQLAGQLGISEERIRVIAPDVGGAFGSKLQMYAEETLVCWCARKLGQAVKWTATRSDDMAATHHGRDQIDYVRLGIKNDGTLTAIHAQIVADMGGYHTLTTPFIPAFSAFVMSGVLQDPAIQTDIVGAFTNKFPTDAIRGAGRPEATHLIEMMMDQAAAEIGMDPLELRRKNFIPKEDFPAEVAIGVIYDSGDYAGALDKLLANLDLDAFRREQEELRAQGIYRGVGFSTYMEICGIAPSRAVGPKGVGLQAGYWESAVVRVHPSGSATVFTGSSPHGQGHETGFAQIVADRIGIPPDQVEIVHGDTDKGPFGMGTYGSRSLAVGGESAARAADKVADKAKKIAAHLLEAAPEDIELADGKYQVRGSPEKAMTVAEVAGAAYIPEDLPEGMEPGLEEVNFYDPENFVWPFGAHACVVDVDVDTGKVKVVRYVCVDDCGPPINPMLIDGQVHGGVTHAIGQALYEQVAYDEAGQLLTSTFRTTPCPRRPRSRPTRPTAR